MAFTETWEPADNPPAGWEWTLLLLSVILAGALRWLWIDFDLDDSFITYTYSRSLAEGHGFWFAGQKSLGTTTPLYALLLGALNFVGLPMVETAKALGMLGAAAACVLLFLIGRNSLGPWYGLGAAALLAVNARHAAVSMSGMETSLYAAVCLGAFYAFQCERPAWTASLAAAACLLRPDGVLLVAVLALSHLIDRRELRVGPLLCFLAPIALWIGYAFYEFGSPIPTSVTAKMAYPEYGPFRLEVAARVFGPELMIPMTALAAVGLIHVCVQARALLPVAAWTVLYLAAFLRAPNFPWYYVPPIAGLVLLALAGVAAIFRIVLPGRAVGWTVVRAAAGLALAGAVGWFTVADTQEHRAWLGRVYGPEVTTAYHSLALWLRDNTLEDATVGVPEVGYVGYYSNRNVLDLAGLCSPQVIPYLPGRRYVEIVQDFKPDYVALTTEAKRPIHNTISESKWFRAHYAACKKFPYRGRLYLVYRRINRAASLQDAPRVARPQPTSTLAATQARRGASLGSGRPAP